MHGCRILVQHEGQPVEVELYGIDCPRPEEPFGEQATELTAEQVLDRTVEIHPERTSDDHVSAVVTLADSDRSLNALLLAKGLAWVHQAYCEKARMCGRWEHVEGRARKSGLGLWSEVPDNMPAWRWVKEKR
jgi:endonuclease YncB( thermonuclease family)